MRGERNYIPHSAAPGVGGGGEYSTSTYNIYLHYA